MAVGGGALIRRWHVAAVAAGNALEFYDFMIYAFFSIQIGHAFFPSQSAYGSLMLSLATFGAGFVTRPIGAAVVGVYADRAGRRPAMLLCFLLIGVSITCMAVIPTYARIGLAAPALALLARMIQGFSLGGEVGCNTAYLMEAARPEQRGLIVAWQSASQACASITGGMVGVALTFVLPPAALDAYGWRIAFLLGASAVPFGFWLRARLPETLAAPAPGSGARVAPPAQLALFTAHWRVLALGGVFLGTATIANYIFHFATTYAQAALHLPARAGFLAQIFGSALGIPATLLGGWISDRYGRRPVNFWGNLALLLVIYPVYAWIVRAGTDIALIVGMTLLYGARLISTGSVLTSITESLPPAIRGAGFGTIYALAIALFGSTTQLAVTWLMHVTGSAMAPAWYLLAATALGQVSVALLGESAPVLSEQEVVLF